jgi:hypothetical protein
MRLKGRFRYYDYDNDSDRIFFPDGYVETDAFPEPSFLPTLINTLPSSYRKINADINLGFDIWTRTRLNLDYRHHRTDRDNREVERQDDHIYGGSVDTSPSEWLDLRTSYERTERDIDNYDFDVYLDGGQDLDQLPELRKYDQADVSRDRAKFLATFYPTEPLAFSSAFTYGKDDYNDSDFGLTDSKYYNISLDADFAVTDRLQLNAFYSYEKYENKQKGRGEFDGGPIIDWNVGGTDEISTFGGGIKVAVIPDRLGFALNFSYSKVDGDIDFDVADGSAEDFDTVDETELYNLDTSLTYNIFAGYYVSLGYYWEKFDYDDYNTEGFAFVPVDDTGAFNGAILSGTLPEDYNTHIFYTTFTIKF